MRLLLDTQIVIWTALFPHRLPADASRAIRSPAAQLLFSSVSIWEVAVKRALGRPDFVIEPQELHDRVLGASYREPSVTSTHAIGVRDLPLIHRDPFDRLLLAQAIAEAATLVTADAILARYTGPVRLV